MSDKKTAIVVIHGLGEQRPMDTISSFVGAAWSADRGLVTEKNSTVWKKPQFVSGSFDLRRITTRKSDADKEKRMDFFEFYWAHHMQGHKVGQLKAWLFGLFARAPATVPKSVFGVWMLGVGLMVLGLAVAVLSAGLKFGAGFELSPTLVATASLFPFIGGFLLNKFILPYAGDAERYLVSSPNNVAIRQKIRKEGVKLIEEITATGKYDRIVLVGHSLGSVIAYDIITFGWSMLDANKMEALHQKDSAALKALTAVEDAGTALNAAADSNEEAFLAFRNAQRDYSTALQGDSDTPFWIVSDLVTVGCPLSKAEVLLAHNLTDFNERMAQREFPACPPIYEDGWKGYPGRFSYPVNAKIRRPHHAAPFGAVVWSNIYVPHKFILIGDVISGPVRHLFGKGVLDVKIPIKRPFRFMHTKYWSLKGDKTTQAVKALRSALNLAEREAEKEVWAAYNEEFGAKEGKK